MEVKKDEQVAIGRLKKLEEGLRDINKGRKGIIGQEGNNL